MKWLNDIKDSASAFKEWARLLTIIGVVMAVSLVIIAIELLVICIRLSRNLIGNSALALLGVFAFLWVANPRKGRLRQHYHRSPFPVPYSPLS